jgi:hypothetical protein
VVDRRGCQVGERRRGGGDKCVGERGVGHGGGGGGAE